MQRRWRTALNILTCRSLQGCCEACVSMQGLSHSILFVCSCSSARPLPAWLPQRIEHEKLMLSCPNLCIVHCLSSHCWQTQPPWLPATLLERGPCQLLRQEHVCAAIIPMLSMPGRCRQQGVAYTAQPGLAYTAQPACLVDGLVGAGATQLPRPVGSQDHHGHLALSGLYHSWQQVGHSCARAGDDGGGSSADTDWWMHRNLKKLESGAPSCPMSVAWRAFDSAFQAPTGWSQSSTRI